MTLPSHTSLLTGTYPYEHGVRDNNGYRVKPKTETLATRLKALGFATGAFVGGFPLDQRFGLNAGFDTYDDSIGETGSTVDFALPERRADAVVASALGWIGAQPIEMVRVGARVRPARALPAARGIRAPLPRRPLRGRDRVDRLRARSALRSPRLTATQDAGRSSPPITAKAWASTAS